MSTHLRTIRNALVHARVIVADGVVIKDTTGGFAIGEENAAPVVRDHNQERGPVPGPATQDFDNDSQEENA